MASPKMQFWIRCDGAVQGPFEKAEIAAKFSALPETAEVSTNQQVWKPLVEHKDYFLKPNQANLAPLPDAPAAVIAPKAELPEIKRVRFGAERFITVATQALVMTLMTGVLLI